MNERETPSGNWPRIVGTTQAFLHIRSREIGYTRSGRGAPVLLIVADAGLRECLRAALARGFTVIAPEPRGQRHGISMVLWLRELIDGLGLARPHLVAAGAGGPVLHFALGDAERIDRLVILWRERAVEGADEGEPALEDRLCCADHPLLLLRLPASSARRAWIEGDSSTSAAGDPCVAKVDAITRFLNADAASEEC